MEAIRNMYAKIGVEEFYKEYGNEYQNPHEKIIKEILSQEHFSGKILDLCCGSGEVSRNIDGEVIGCDPFTAKLYKEKTGNECLEYSFKDIATGKMREYHFDHIICSFALHLCEESMLNQVLFELSMITKNLIIITPHKKPEIKNFWELISEKKVERVRIRKYRSLLFC